MFGFRTAENFDYPYASASVTEFWRRWHISLGSWFRDYVYIPLGGNREGTGKQIRNLLIVWALTGFWHGAAWTFVAWGLYYGAVLIFEKFIFGGLLKILPAFFKHAYTMFIVIVGWVFFASSGIGAAGGYLKAMSLSVKPVAEAQLNPSPISTPFTAPIDMAFDECPSSVAEKSYIANSVARTSRWLKRCKEEMARLNSLDETINPNQLLFGINQGGIYSDIRIEHAQEISELNLDGYAVGGLAVGESKEEMYRVLDDVVPYLPADKPTYLMGVGTPDNILESVSRGVDFFDCVYPSRNGRHGTKTSNFGVCECDLLIVIGARFSDRVTSNTKKFIRHARILQIDIDPAEINKNVLVHASVIGDINEVLKRLNAALKQENHDEWLGEIADYKKKYPMVYPGKNLTGPFAVEEIYRQTKGEAIITTEVGQHQMWAAQYYTYTNPRTFLTSGGLGTMGYGLGAAIGAKAGLPDKTVINVAGDGCFRMTHICPTRTDIFKAGKVRSV